MPTGGYLTAQLTRDGKSIEPKKEYGIQITMFSPDGTFTNTIGNIPVEALRSGNLHIQGLDRMTQVFEFSVYGVGARPAGPEDFKVLSLAMLVSPEEKL